jgi:poly-gamma-glutamate synthesis protein (capsule biosynthesis protein)
MPEADRLTLFLGGDVMTGRGVDQILPCPGAPELHESHIRDARDYVALAERANGPIARPVDARYIWGEARTELQRVAPAVRIVNLETSITRDAAHREAKGINYRMHPANVACLTAAGIDVCALANNHVLDHGRPGLEETLASLAAAGLKTAGAGRSLAEARRPAIVERPGGPRVIVFSSGTETSGIPPAWAATATRPGVDLLVDLSDRTADELVARLRRVKRAGDIAVASLHWGGNWGYAVPRAHVRFAHRLVEGGIDIVHGHSSHHPRPIEVYRGKLVLYGCGDLIDDYEGIPGHEEFRDDLALMYFPTVDAHTGDLIGLRMAPMRIRKMQLTRASPAETDWLATRLASISDAFGSRTDAAPDGSLLLRWPAAPQPTRPVDRRTPEPT